MSDWDFLWGLSGQALEDAMSSGATYEEWGLIEQELDRELIGPNGKNVMVFVDGENVPAKYYDQVRSQVEWLVDHHQAKVYARQKDGATQRWHEVSMESGIKEIRLIGGPAKNKVDKGHRDAFVRIGNESVKANATQLKRLVLKSEHRSFDSLETGYQLNDYSFEVLRATYHDKTHKAFENSDFESFGLVTDRGTLTNAGALFADNSPVRHSRVFCTRWNGLDKTSGVMEALDDKEFSGGLVSLLNSTKAFIATNTKIMWRKTPDSRMEYPEYPERATTECVVNALMHRDYLELGSEVHVEIYDDRMEIYSPGGLPNGKRAQDYDVFTTPSKRRNPIIANMLSAHGLDGTTR